MKVSTGKYVAIGGFTDTDGTTSLIQNLEVYGPFDSYQEAETWLSATYRDVPIATKPIIRPYKDK